MQLGELPGSGVSLPGPGGPPRDPSPAQNAVSRLTSGLQQRGHATGFQLPDRHHPWRVILRKQQLAELLATQVACFSGRHAALRAARYAQDDVNGQNLVGRVFRMTPQIWHCVGLMALTAAYEELTPWMSGFAKNAQPDLRLALADDREILRPQSARAQDDIELHRTRVCNWFPVADDRWVLAHTQRTMALPAPALTRWPAELHFRNQPVHVQLLDRPRELKKIHRLANVRIRPQAVALQNILLLGRGSEDYHRHQGRVLVLAQLSQHFQPVCTWAASNPIKSPPAADARLRTRPAKTNNRGLPPHPAPPPPGLPRDTAPAHAGGRSTSSGLSSTEGLLSAPGFSSPSEPLLCKSSSPGARVK